MTHRAFRALTPVVIALSAAAGLSGCRDAPPTVPPHTDFIVAAGDSTFWVHSGPAGIRLRRSSLFLTRFDGRFYEVYTADDDRSFYDAVLVGQHIFRRDLITGDSMAVYTDTLVPAMARAYARAHPTERPLGDDDDPSDDPRTVATTEAELLDLYGPYLSVEYHTDVDAADGSETHVTRRGVIDLRRARPATLDVLFGVDAAQHVAAAGRHAYDQALDSVRTARDRRARRAAESLAGFAFDTASYLLTDADGSPAVTFVVPGRGIRADGYWLPLPPIAVPPPAPSWWRDIAGTLPRETGDTTRDMWPGNRYQVIAKYDTSADRFTLIVRDSTGHEWSMATLPSPPRTVFRLDDPQVDSAARRALARAFDASTLYSEDARTVLAPRTHPRDMTPTRLTKSVRESQHESSRIMMPEDANNLGHVFGGVVLGMMDTTAAVAAIRHARQTCVTASIDRVDFREPIHLGDLVIMKASVNYVGRTSMEVGVRVEAEDLLSGLRRHTNSCYLTFVAVDRNGRPAEVPGLVPETDDEKRRFAAAQERRRRRLEERDAEERAVAAAGPGRKTPASTPART